MPAASIRYNNPGAQYPGPSARKFKSTGHQIIGGGHKIAVFGSKVDGAAALFDLLDRVYSDRLLAAIIRKWSGGHDVRGYLRLIKAKAGLNSVAMIDKEFLGDAAKAIGLARAMAWHEAGGEYPMTDEEWMEAHKRFSDARS